jgi:uncharacterized protein YrrD
MRSAKELIGKPIYSVTDGRLLGTVKDLYVDSDMNHVTGVFVGSEGLFSRRARLIPGDRVSVLGVDAVLTLESNVIKDDSGYAPSQEWLRRDSVQGRIMNTAGGTKVGTVGDLLIDDDYKVVAFSLARVNVEGPIARSRIVTRTAVTDAGGFDGSIVVDLSEAEQPAMGLGSITEPVSFEPNMQPAQSSDTAGPEPEDDSSA